MSDVNEFRRRVARPLRVIGVACGMGAADRRCEAGPDALRAAGLIDRLKSRGLEAAWTETIRPAGTDPLDAVAGACGKLAQRVADTIRDGELPVVLGGDHSCAIGTWKGAARALAPSGPVGLLWSDAHMDAHTPQTTPTGALHGMPLACLLGHGDPVVTALADSRRIAPQHVCLIGVRSFEPGEAALLKRL